MSGGPRLSREERMLLMELAASCAADQAELALIEARLFRMVRHLNYRKIREWQDSRVQRQAVRSVAGDVLRLRARRRHCTYADIGKKFGAHGTYMNKVAANYARG